MLQLIASSMVLGAELVVVGLIVAYEVDQRRRWRARGGIPTAAMEAMLGPGLQSVFGKEP
jgi:hypothetical protein